MPIIRFLLLTSSVFLFGGCGVKEYDISGHWHLTKSNKKGTLLTKELLYTLDVYGQSAYFNLPDLRSTDRKLQQESDTTWANVDTLERRIVPYGFLQEQGIQEITYNHLSDTSRLFTFNTREGEKKYYRANYSLACDKSDYCHFNPQVPHWCQMDIALPDLAVSDNLRSTESEYVVDLYLGFLPHADSVKLGLNINAEKDIDFPDLARITEAYRQSITPTERSRIRYNLHIDKNVPYRALNYLRWNLRKSNQLAVNYQLNEAVAVAVKWPPYLANNCSRFSFSQTRTDCKREKILTVEDQHLLTSYGLQAHWNPTIKYEELRLKSENLFVVGISDQGDLIARGEVVSKTELLEQSKDFIWLAEQPNNKVFLVQPSSGAPSGRFLEAYISLREAYAWVHEQAAQDIYGKDFKDLSKQDQRNIRNKYPYVVSTTDFK